MLLVPEGRLELPLCFQNRILNLRFILIPRRCKKLLEVD